VRAVQRVIFKVAILAYQRIRGVAPGHLSDGLYPVADVPGCSRLRLASTLELVVPLTRLSTVGDRSFPIDTTKLWNSLPHNVIEATFLLSFRKQLETRIFSILFSLSSDDLFRFSFIFIFDCFILIAIKRLKRSQKFTLNVVSLLKCGRCMSLYTIFTPDILAKTVAHADENEQIFQVGAAGGRPAALVR
jgi:hypothetical protein